MHCISRASRGAAVLSVALSGAGALAAAEAPPEEVVVVATREPAASFRLPVTVQVVDAAQMLERQYRTLPQVLRDVPGIMVQETAFGQGSPYLRGFTGFRNVFLIDGVRLNNSVFRDGPNQYWSTVDVYGLDRLEVLKGPASTLYGSDAIGGTVSAVTRDPFLAPSRGLVRMASAESSATGRLDAAFRLGDRSALAVGATARHFGDLEGGRDVGEQHGIGYDEHAVDVRMAHLLPSGWRLDGLVQQVRQNNVPRTHQTVDAVPWHGAGIGSDLKRELDQERRLAYLRLGNSSLDGPIGGLWITTSYGTTEESRDRIRSSGRREKQGFTVDTLGLLVQARSATPLGTLTYGVDFYRDEVDSFSSTNPVQGPVADDARYRSVDVFLQDRIALRDRGELVLGVRRTRSEADAGSVLDTATGGTTRLEDTWSANVASIGASWGLVPERLLVFGNVSQGFRAPNLSDLTRLDTARSNEFEVPAPGLREERFVSFETGLKLRYPAGGAQLAYFHTDIDDLIQRVPTGRIVEGLHEVSKANLGDGWIDGVELGWHRQLTPRVRVFGTVTWMDGEAETFPTSDPVVVSEPLDRLMPLTASVGVRWSASRWWLEGLVSAADGQDDLSTRDAADTTRIPPGGTPGFAVAHVHAGYRLSERIELTLGVDNVTDRDYRIHGSGTNMPGRNMMLSVETAL